MTTENAGYTAAELRQILEGLIVELEERQKQERLATNPKLVGTGVSPLRVIKDLLPELLARNNQKLLEDIRRLG